MNGFFESFLGHARLRHEAHGVFAHSDVSPDRVVPSSASKLKNGCNEIRFFLRTVRMVMVFVVVMDSVAKLLLETANFLLQVVDTLDGSLDGSMSSLFSTLGFSSLNSLLVFFLSLFGFG